MILQSLVRLYEDLNARGAIASPGWSDVKVSFALYLDDEGEIIQIGSLKQPTQNGKKTMPRLMQVPAPVKRTAGVAANFLCDNSGYFLGVDAKGKPARTKECFDECKKLHLEILKGVDSPAATAIIRFFEKWDPEAASAHPVLSEQWEELISGVNLVFRYQGKFAQEDPAIRSVWETHYLSSTDGPEMVCLVTGRNGPVQTVHPSIKGLYGAQSSGAALVSFNATAFCSYGKEQSANAPTGQYAAFAYTSALNYLLADRLHTFYVGDTAVLCWAQGAEPAYQDCMCANLLEDPETYDLQDIRDKTARLLRGMPVEFDGTKLDPDRPFFVLGLAPNAARISVRFFLRNSFGDFLRNIDAHHRRLEIIRPSYDKYELIPIWKMLSETVNQKSQDKKPSSVMAGETMRAVLTNTRYPATLLNGVQLRIRAEHEITRGRAAIIKAYYLKNPDPNVPKEVLQVALNKDSDNVAYNLGRLFSVLENIQNAANPGINTTIRDKYFNSASATPATVFPVLVNLAQKHLRKLGGGLAVTLSKQLGEIMEKLPESYPVRLSLPQQGAFQLGYYHQTQDRFQKKDKED